MTDRDYVNNAVGGSPTGITSFKNIEIRTHASLLFNERLHALFFSLEDMQISFKSDPKFKKLLQVRAILFEIWKMIRPIVKNDPRVRSVVLLNTKFVGLYTLDVVFRKLELEVRKLYSNEKEIKTEDLWELSDDLDNIEVILRDILQYYRYFIKLSKDDIPDMEVISSKYKKMIDELTFTELKKQVGEKFIERLGINEKTIEKEYFEEFYKNDEDPNVGEISDEDIKKAMEEDVVQ